MSNQSSSLYLESCYSWDPKDTLKISNEIETYTYQIHAIADGYIRYREQNFQGELEYVYVKNPSGSDLRETHLRFEANLGHFGQNIKKMNDANFSLDTCEISGATLSIKSAEKDVDLDENLLIYLAFGNWDESQTNIEGVPRTTESVGLLASVPMNLNQNEWTNVVLNESILCSQVFDCENLLESEALYSWDIIVSSSQASKNLKFYSKESSVQNTAYINIDFRCS